MRVLILFAYEYPSGTAMANRVQKLARGVMAAGAEVRLLGVGTTSGGRSAGWEYDSYGIPYRLLAMPRGKSRLKMLVGRARLRATFREETASLLHSEEISSVIIFGTSGWLFGAAADFAMRQNTVVVMDAVEWFGKPRSFPDALWLLEQAYTRRYIFPKISGVIGITSFWEDYCSSRGLSVIRIPALGDEEERAFSVSANQNRDRVFRLMYLGVLSWRDLPETMLRGVQMAEQRGMRVVLVVAGKAVLTASGRRFIAKVRKDARLTRLVEITGWLSDEQLKQKMAEADAFVLLRPDNRETRACFPTRLPEYLATGRPVVLSRVGDVGKYFEHRLNAWLVTPGSRAKELCEALMHLSTNPSEARSIGLAGRRTALDEFSFHRNGQRLMEFLDGLKNAPRITTAASH